VEGEALVRGAAQMWTRVGERAQRRLAVLFEQAEALPGTLQRRIGRRALGHRHQRAAALLCGVRDGELGQARAHARELECEQIAGSHAGSIAARRGWLNRVVKVHRWPFVVRRSRADRLATATKRLAQAPTANRQRRTANRLDLPPSA